MKFFASIVHASLAFTVAACGGGGGTPTAPAGPASAPPVALQASQPGALLGYVQAKLNLQIDLGLSGNGDGAVTLAGAALPATASPVAAGAGVSATAYASTTLQEGGVDESDLLKTDGNRLFALTVASPGDQTLARLSRYQRQADGSLQANGSLALVNTDRFDGLHLAASGEHVAVIGQNQPYGLPIIATQAALTVAPGSVLPVQTVVNLVSARAGLPLTNVQSLRIDGQLINTRTIDNTLYVVTSWFPRFDDVFPVSGATTAQRREAVTRITTPQILPTVTVTGASGASTKQALLGDTDCHVQTANASVAVQLTTITAINLASPTFERSSRCMLGGVNAIYMSEKSLYLASSRYKVSAQGNTLFYPAQPVTDIHKFTVSGMSMAYRASGEVNGHLGWDATKTSYRLSEYQNDLRVVTYTSSVGWLGDIAAPVKTAPVSPALLTVLREDPASAQLKAVSSLPNAQRPTPIGLSGEQVYAVRFLGERAYVVTFQRIDPLYVIDLSDPLDPKMAGELKTNGYSDDLLPVGNGLLLGVGKDATDTGVVQGVKVSLFDVSNASAPKELDSRVLGKAGSLSALDYSRHGINLFPVGNITRVALPVRLNETLANGSTSFRPSVQNLARFEVDTVTRKLIDKASLPGQVFSTDMAGYLASPLGFERSVQVGPNIYYLGSQGALTGASW